MIAWPESALLVAIVLALAACRVAWRWNVVRAYQAKLTADEGDKQRTYAIEEFDRRMKLQREEDERRVERQARMN